VTWRPSRKILVIAHRGARSVAPENTLAAARRAWHLGADGWEFDVQATKDGELVLMHDETLVRTTDAREAFPSRAPWQVGGFALDEVRRLDAGAWFVAEDPFGTLASGEALPEKAAQFRGERVPTLEEALLHTRELGLLANIELKGTPLSLLADGAKEGVVEKVATLVRELGMEERVIVSSFDHTLIRHLKRIAPGVAGALLVMSLPANPLRYLREMGADALNPRASAFDSEMARGLRGAGYGVYVWTVNEPDELTRFAREPDVAGIITDWPQRLCVSRMRARGQGRWRT